MGEGLGRVVKGFGNDYKRVGERLEKGWEKVREIFPNPF